LRSRVVAVFVALALLLVLAPSGSAHAKSRAGLSLRMRAAPSEVGAKKKDAASPEVGAKKQAPSPEQTRETEASSAPPEAATEGSAPETPSPSPEPAPPRAYDGPTAVTDVPGREAPWHDPRDPAATAPAPAPEPAETAPEPSAPAAVTPTVPPPSSVREVPEHITVAVGLAPEAPGSRDEKALLSDLEATVRASTNPTTDVRRLRPGAGAPHRICRQQREDLVVMIGYLADRPTPVVLAHDCRLDRALSVRAADAAREPGLVAALWSEHLELMRAGARERRRLSVGPRARAGIIAGVAIVVVGVAVGALVANALREQTVVLTVRP